MSAQRELWSRTVGERSAVEHATKVAPSALASLVNEVQWMKPGERFTSENVVGVLSPAVRGCFERAPNCIGATISALARQGVIRKTGHYFPSTRPAARGRAIAEWERV